VHPQPAITAFSGWAVDADPPPVALTGDPAEFNVLWAEHQGLLSARALVYNEAFTRITSYFQLLGMSFVGLALIGNATDFDDAFLVVTILTLSFDLVMGTLAFIRISAANSEETRTVMAINRVRNGFVRVAPGAMPFLDVAPYDDYASVMQNYGPQSTRAVPSIVYGLSTSAGTVALVVCLVAGLLAAAVAAALALPLGAVLGAGIVTTVVVFLLFLRWAFALIAAHSRTIRARFPAPDADRGPGAPPPTA
jgi:hypothetical protein